ncbi:hypothetical protein FIBSPDRAFT_898309 [Athelia psychrophila]|uniref:Uncharacterized protein n=1 Tax=Athelia psychrophila TaxID=1759441 RepID=A0A166B6S9_9AGAM|nr:hypothetical protein FIBSPDRAFT_898309 [Fibularhizoctonia sp. CBS 109695]
MFADPSMATLFPTGSQSVRRNAVNKCESYNKIVGAGWFLPHGCSAWIGRTFETCPINGHFKIYGQTLALTYTTGLFRYICRVPDHRSGSDFAESRDHLQRQLERTGYKRADLGMVFEAEIGVQRGTSDATRPMTTRLASGGQAPRGRRTIKDTIAIPLLCAIRATHEMCTRPFREIYWVVDLQPGFKGSQGRWRPVTNLVIHSECVGSSAELRTYDKKYVNLSSHLSDSFEWFLNVWPVPEIAEKPPEDTSAFAIHSRILWKLHALAGTTSSQFSLAIKEAPEDNFADGLDPSRRPPIHIQLKLDIV